MTLSLFVTSAAVVEDFAFYRQVLVLCHAGRSGVVQFLQFGNGILDVSPSNMSAMSRLNP